MDVQFWINFGGTVGLSVLGWILTASNAKSKDERTKREALETALTNFRIEVARDYVTTHDLADIKTTLVRIETKLDAKADK